MASRKLIEHESTLSSQKILFFFIHTRIERESLAKRLEVD